MAKGIEDGSFSMKTTLYPSKIPLWSSQGNSVQFTENAVELTFTRLMFTAAKGTNRKLEQKKLETSLLVYHSVNGGLAGKLGALGIFGAVTQFLVSSVFLKIVF